MEIRKVDQGHKRTAAEPMKATIRLPSGDFIIIRDVIIPETPVTKIRPWYWLVSACTGQGETFEGKLTTNLPPEPTTWSFWDFTMVAQPIDSPTLLVLADGSRWTGSVTFPRCRISNILGDPNLAEAVVATGTLNLISGSADA